MPTPIFCVSLNKAAEFWLIRFRPDRTAEAYRTLSRWAADPNLDFTWYDAAVMSGLLREGTRKLEIRADVSFPFLAGEDIQYGELVYWDEKTRSIKPAR